MDFFVQNNTVQVLCIHSKNHWSICLIWCNVFPSKGCDVRVLEKSPGEYYTRDEIEQVKIYFFY